MLTRADAVHRDSTDPLAEWRQKAEARRLSLEADFTPAQINTGGFVTEYKISGPARVRKRKLEARTSADSGTLQIDKLCVWPSALACCKPASVSAVSPDCEIVITKVRASGTESR